MSFVDISSLRRSGTSVLNRAAASVVGQATNAISNSISNIGLALSILTTPRILLQRCTKEMCRLRSTTVPGSHRCTPP